MKRLISLLLILLLILSQLTVVFAAGKKQQQEKSKADADSREEAYQEWIEDLEELEHLLEEATEDPEDEGHHFSAVWTMDEGSHWRLCEDEDCEEVKGYGAHEYGTWETNGTNHWQACTVCGYKTDEAPHTWDAGKITKEASCVENGVKTYTCTVCGATKTADIPMVAHSWDGGTTTKKPTVTEKGESTFKCIACGKTVTREIAPMGESMSPEELLTVKTAPTNDMDGRLDDEKWVVLQAATTDEEYARVQNGWPITVTLSVRDVTEEIGHDMLQMVQESIDKQKTYCFLDVELTKELFQDQAQSVTELKNPIIVALTLPETLLQSSRGKTKGLSVYRVGDDWQLEKVTAKRSDDEKSLLLQIYSVGTYVVTYLDKRVTGVEPVVFLYGGLGVVALGGIGYLGYRLFFAKTDEEDDEEFYEEE